MGPGHDCVGCADARLGGTAGVRDPSATCRRRRADGGVADRVVRDENGSPVLTITSDEQLQCAAVETTDVYMQEIPESVRATVDSINQELREKKQGPKRAEGGHREICYQLLPTTWSASS